MLKAEFTKLLDELKILSVVGNFPEENDNVMGSVNHDHLPYKLSTPVSSSSTTTTGVDDDDEEEKKDVRDGNEDVCSSVGTQTFTTTKLTPASASVQPLSGKRLSLHQL